MLAIISPLLYVLGIFYNKKVKTRTAGLNLLPLQLPEQSETQEGRGPGLRDFVLTHEILEGFGIHQDINP